MAVRRVRTLVLGILKNKMSYTFKPAYPAGLTHLRSQLAQPVVRSLSWLDKSPEQAGGRQRLGKSQA